MMLIYKMTILTVNLMMSRYRMIALTILMRMIMLVLRPHQSKYAQASLESKEWAVRSENNNNALHPRAKKSKLDQKSLFGNHPSPKRNFPSLISLRNLAQLGLFEGA